MNVRFSHCGEEGGERIEEREQHDGSIVKDYECV